MKADLASILLLGSLFASSALAVTVTVTKSAAHTVPTTLCKPFTCPTVPPDRMR